MSESKCFVRAEFYIQPPTKDAPVSEWNTWAQADRKAAIQAKRAFTLEQVPCDTPDAFQETTTRKIGGVWRQATNIGVSGSEDDGFSLEPAIEATQELDFARARFEIKARGSSSHLSGAAKRKAKKLRRKNRKE